MRGADYAARNKDPIAERQSRVSARFWADQKPFHHAGPTLADRMAGMLPGLAAMVLWAVLLLWQLIRSGRQEQP